MLCSGARRLGTCMSRRPCDCSTLYCRAFVQPPPHVPSWPPVPFACVHCRAGTAMWRVTPGLPRLELARAGACLSVCSALGVHLTAQHPPFCPPTSPPPPPVPSAHALPAGTPSSRGVNSRTPTRRTWSRRRAGSTGAGSSGRWWWWWWWSCVRGGVGAGSEGWVSWRTCMPLRQSCLIACL